ncbi:MAG TPA: hypothetical protein DHU62_05610 [Firmicutes bacterium]|nr:hypothetical protein [Bacillota bacterium]
MLIINISFNFKNNWKFTIKLDIINYKFYNLSRKKEKLYEKHKEGKIRSIGISNFEGEYIQDLLKEFDVIPQVIQVECHPFYPQEELRKVTDKLDIKIMSWYPLGGKGMTAELLENPTIVNLANKHHKTSAQIVLKWHIEMEVIVIPGSKNIDHIKDNIDLFDFTLTKEDMNQIASLNNGQRRYIRTDEALERFLNWKITYEKE